MDELKKIISETIKEVMSELGVKEELPPSGEEKYSKQEPGGEMATANVSTATWREGSDDTEERVETKVLSGQGTAYFHNHGCIIANNSGVPLKVICTEMKVGNQRAYYARIDEA